MEQQPFCLTDYTPADDAPGRVLSDAEFAEAAGLRPDIFQAEKSGRMISIQTICMIAAAAVIAVMSNRVPAVDAAADFYEKSVTEPFRGCILIRCCGDHYTERLKVVRWWEVEDAPTGRRIFTPAKSHGLTSAPSGGDPRDRVSQMGILGKISGQVRGKGGFASDVDVFLSGAGGLKTIGSGGSGRRGAAGIDPHANYSPNPDAGIVNDPLGGLMMNPDGRIIELLRRGAAAVSISGPYIDVNASGRSEAFVRRALMRYMTPRVAAAIRRAYGRRLLDKPWLRGTIAVEFWIDKFGKVTAPRAEPVSLDDPKLKNILVGMVRGWTFGQTYSLDYATVSYRFIFSR